MKVGDYVWLSPNGWIDRDEVGAVGHPYRIIGVDKFGCFSLDALGHQLPDHDGFRNHKSCHKSYVELDPFRTAVWLEKHGKHNQG